MQEFILLNNTFHEIGPAFIDVDFEAGTSKDSTNDFKIETNLINSIEFYALYLEGTELGGIINVDKSTNITDLHSIQGLTWRGILTRHIVEPPAGADYKTVSGDLNAVIAELIQPLSPLYTAKSTSAGHTVTNYKINRYVSILAAIEKLLSDSGYRLKIEAVKEAAGEAIKIILSAVPQTTLAGTYNSDLYIPMEFTKDTSGYNHIIAAGRGELAAREIVNLYADAEGNIGTTQYFTGIEESTYFYDYSNVESLEELEKSAREELEKLLNKKVLKIAGQDEQDERLTALEIGDKVRATFPGGDVVEAAVIQKIYTVANGIIKTQIKIEGGE